jgi:hypothetical protein
MKTFGMEKGFIFRLYPFAFIFRFILPPSSFILRIAERSHSGLVHRSRKPEWVYAHRGFESHPLRHDLKGLARALILLWQAFLF